MTLASWDLNGIGKALLPVLMSSLQRIAERRHASADTPQLESRTESALCRIEMDAMSATASRGLEIRRALPTAEAVEWFIDQMQSHELTGERTWQALWDCYLWLCEEADFVPLPETMKARFAHELSKFCRRGQVRIREGGKLRRLTTYAVPDVEPAYLRAAG